jgi:serine/threonine protein kinase
VQVRTTGKHIKPLTAMLNRQYRRGDQQVQDLIHAEAHISARLRHPHLNPTVDFGFEDEVPYLVMKDAMHGTLRTLYPRSFQVSPPRVVWPVRHIAQAPFFVHRAHKERRKEKEMYHDISPPHQSNRSLASGCRNVGRNS